MSVVHFFKHKVTIIARYHQYSGNQRHPQQTEELQMRSGEQTAGSFQREEGQRSLPSHSHQNLEANARLSTNQRATREGGDETQSQQERRRGCLLWTHWAAGCPSGSPVSTLKRKEKRKKKMSFSQPCVFQSNRSLPVAFQRSSAFCATLRHISLHSLSLAPSQRPQAWVQRERKREKKRPEVKNNAPAERVQIDRVLTPDSAEFASQCHLQEKGDQVGVSFLQKRERERKAGPNRRWSLVCAW